MAIYKRAGDAALTELLRQLSFCNIGHFIGRFEIGGKEGFIVPFIAKFKSL
jgi:hypothetical protein